MPDLKDHVALAIIAFLAIVALGCFTALSIVGADGTPTLRDVLLAIVGGLLGVAVGKAPTP